MKRKEQNRAAQRAFRERKEKHVKDVRCIKLVVGNSTDASLLFSSKIRSRHWKIVIRRRFRKMKVYGK